MPNETTPTLCPLPGIRFVEVTGADAEAFLNAQLSRDVAPRTSTRARLCGWHDSKGRVRALLRPMRRGEDFLLLAHGADPDLLIRALSIFVLRSDVRLTDVSAGWHGAVALGDVDGWLAARGSTLGRSPGDTAGTNGAVLIRVGPQMAYLAATTDAREALESEFSLADGARGELAEIRAGLVDVTPELAERFTPQMLNLDRHGALAFDKGCFPGQEVIARIQNLGSVKRRLFRYSGSVRETPRVGSALIDASGDDVGEVVRSARTDERNVELLAVVRTEAANERLACSAEPEAALARRDLPDEPKSGH